MSQVRKFVDFLINEYIFLSFIIVSFILFVYESIEVSHNLAYILLVFISTLLLYKYISPIKSFSQLLTQKGFLLAITSILIFFLFSLVLTFQSLLYLGLAGLLTMFYFFGWSNILKPLRTYLLLKPFIIGMVYSILICQIPMIEAHYLAHEYMYSAGAIFFFVSALAIVFDIGDLEEDAIITTFPNAMGIVSSKILMTFLMFIAGIAMYYSAWTYLISIPASVAFGLSCFASIIIGWRTTPLQPKFFFLLYVDGAMALPFVITLLFKFF